jgi:hypothetical protein
MMPELPPEVTRPRRLAETAAAALGTGPGRSTLAAQRRALMQAADELQSRRWPRWGWFAAAALLATLGAMVLLLRAPPELATFEGRALSEGQIMRAGPGSAGQLSLSDGTRVQLSSGTAVVLSELSSSRTRLTLRGGSVAAHVSKRPNRAFSVVAGAYEVRVVGTVFSVVLEGQDVSVQVTEGKVLVRGGKLPDAGVLLAAGQRFDTRTQHLQPRTEGSPPPATPVASTAQERSSAPAIVTPKTSWSELSRSGRYREALELAEQLGFEQLTRTLGDDDLLLLANTARFAGDGARAKLAFKSIRSRFSGRPAAGLSALYLARIAEAHDHDPAAAARWLRLFLAEAPRSEMAPGARASLIDIALKRGNQAEARSAAADYLAHHPKGPHAGQARALLDPTQE